HNVEFINDLCDKVVVLDQGVKLTEGTPEQIHRDARVLDAYLGLAPGQGRAAAVAK
ncbi:MAG: ABC transporter ATP-binding protein, partial [Alphaproteobacteria bacterium]|nr:ABC transporter ATP-binding protein [Alphaproteobacteria bacterium]